MRRLLAARRELSIRGRIIEFFEMWSKFKKLKNFEFCEFGEFHQKLKNSEKCINSKVWRSLGAIGIDSVSFEAFRSVSSFFICFQFLSSGLEGPVGVVS